MGVLSASGFDREHAPVVLDGVDRLMDDVRVGGARIIAE